MKQRWNCRENSASQTDTFVLILTRIHLRRCQLLYNYLLQQKSDMDFKQHLKYRVFDENKALGSTCFGPDLRVAGMGEAIPPNSRQTEIFITAD